MKRYDAPIMCGDETIPGPVEMEEDDDGEWVRYDDIQAGLRDEEGLTKAIDLAIWSCGHEDIDSEYVADAVAHIMAAIKDRLA